MASPLQRDRPAPSSRLRTAGDPHAHQPFRRYFLGPSPVSSSQAAKIAAAIKHEVGVTKPAGVSIACREGFVLLKAPAKTEALEDNADAYITEEEDERELQSVQQASKRRNPSSYPLSYEGMPENRRCSLRRDPSAASAFSFVSAHSMPESSRGCALSRSSTPLLASKDQINPHLKTKSTDASEMETGFKKPRKQLSFDVLASAQSRRKGIHSYRGAGSPILRPEKVPREKGRLQSSAPLDASSASHDNSSSFANAPTPTELANTSLQPTQFEGDPDDRHASQPLCDELSIKSHGPHQKSSFQSLRKMMSRRKFQDSADPGFKESNASARPKAPENALIPRGNTLEVPVGILHHHSGSHAYAERNSSNFADEDTPQANGRYVGPSSSSAHFSQLRQPRRDVSIIRHQPLQKAGGGHVRSSPFHISVSPSHGCAHVREFSRHSRTSGASTAGTFASIGLASSTGSFGASGRVRPRIVKIFRPRAFTFRETPSEQQRANRRVTAAELASLMKETRRRWKGGVALGQVGTSSGGTKWVGQSFEVGRRFWEVVQLRENELTKSQENAPEHSNFPFSPPLGPHRGEATIYEQSEDSTGSEGEQDAAAGKRGDLLNQLESTKGLMNRTASAVLKTFVREANMVQDQREEHDLQEKVSSTEENGDHIQVEPLRGDVNKVSKYSGKDLETPAFKAGIKAVKALSTKLTLPQDEHSERPLLQEQMRTQILSMPEPFALSASAQKAPRQRTQGSASDNIESRHGWSDIASVMSAHSLLQSSNFAKSIVDRAEQRFKVARSSLVKSGRDSKGIKCAGTTSALQLLGQVTAVRRNVSVIGEEDKSNQGDGNLFPPIPAKVFKTPFEMPLTALQNKSDGGLVSYFESHDQAGGYADAAARENNGQIVPQRMTLNQALKHPDPAMGAEEKFSRAALTLLYRSSDLSEREHPPNAVLRITTNAANDPAIVHGHFTTSPQEMTFLNSFSATDSKDVNSQAQRLSSTGLSSSSNRKSAVPLLRKNASTGSFLIHDSQPTGTFGQSKRRQKISGKSCRKTVQFDKLALSRRSLPFRSMSSLSAPITDGASRRGGVQARNPGDAAPVPPDIVLSRPSSPSASQQPSPQREKLLMGERSDGHTSAAEADDFITRRSILRRDRMLVKNDWTPAETVPRDLDETGSRRFSIYPGEWHEYIVVLRQGRVELWAEPTRAVRLKGYCEQLRPAFIVPLYRGSTNLSIFSYIDRIFCLAYSQQTAATHVLVGGKRRMLNLKRYGTNIMLFDARLPSTAADWVWDLWREIGGLVPDSLEVHIPVHDQRVRFPIDSEMPCQQADQAAQKLAPGDGRLVMIAQGSNGGDEGYKLMNRARLSAMMLNVVKKNPEWEEIVQMMLGRGINLALAWRLGATLDWVLYDQAIDGKLRNWSVLCGTVLKGSRQSASLEYRVASHYPTNVTLASGENLPEPPSIEGFIWRVKPVSGVLARLYITTHDHHAFICKPAKAFPPDRHIAVSLEEARPRDESSANGVPHSRPRRARSTSAASAATGSLTGWSDAGSTRSSRPGSTSETSVGGRGIDNFGRRNRFAATGIGGAHSRSRRKKGRDDSLLALRKHVLDTIASVATTPAEVAAQVAAFRAFERRRQFDQICNAEGYIDVKDIFMIKYLGKDVAECNTEVIKMPGSEGPDSLPMPLPTSHENHYDDESDLGGEEGLNTSADRAAMRRARQFEVVMNNGRFTSFEAYSRSLAKEWVSRLHDLSVYWKRREKVDALEAMEVCGVDTALIRRKKTCGPGANSDTVALLGSGSGGNTGAYAGSSTNDVYDLLSTSQNLLLSNIWNWCTIQACRGIVRAGHLYVKDRPLAPFRSRHYILISGRLLCFKLLTNTRTARGRQNAGIFHKRAGGAGSGKGEGPGPSVSVIPLRDSYVWSGHLTEAQVGSVGRSEAAGAMGPFASGGAAYTGSSSRHRVPRIYADGLLSVDEHEECTFVIRYRIARVNPPGDGPGLEVLSKDYDLSFSEINLTNRQDTPTEGVAGLVKAPIPPLTDDGNYALLTMRARSRLERDLWIRAINGERERMARASQAERAREIRLRNEGETPYKCHSAREE